MHARREPLYDEEATKVCVSRSTQTYESLALETTTGGATASTRTTVSIPAFAALRW
jgi:hypothetical protein